MTLDEEELGNHTKERTRLWLLKRYHAIKEEEYRKRWEESKVRIDEILARIEAAKGSTDGN